MYLSARCFRRRRRRRAFIPSLSFFLSFFLLLVCVSVCVCFETIRAGAERESNEEENFFFCVFPCVLYCASLAVVLTKSIPQLCPGIFLKV